VSSILGRDGAVLLDSGVLIALYARDDPFHAAVVRWIDRFEGALHTVGAVLVETAYFLPAGSAAAVARLPAEGGVVLHHPDAAGCARIADLLLKYADRGPDWADLELVWLAEQTGIRRIATLDVTDFSVYRIHGRARFELELLR
jgi:predicted nucleic acid-binding protein